MKAFEKGDVSRFDFLKISLVPSHLCPSCFYHLPAFFGKEEERVEKVHGCLCLPKYLLLKIQSVG